MRTTAIVALLGRSGAVCRRFSQHAANGGDAHAKRARAILVAQHPAPDAEMVQRASESDGGLTALAAFVEARECACARITAS